MIIYILKPSDIFPQVILLNIPFWFSIFKLIVTNCSLLPQMLPFYHPLPQHMAPSLIYLLDQAIKLLVRLPLHFSLLLTSNKLASPIDFPYKYFLRSTTLHSHWHKFPPPLSSRSLSDQNPFPVILKSIFNCFRNITFLLSCSPIHTSY